MKRNNKSDSRKNYSEKRIGKSKRTDKKTGFNTGKSSLDRKNDRNSDRKYGDKKIFSQRNDTDKRNDGFENPEKSTKSNKRPFRKPNNKTGYIKGVTPGKNKKRPIPTVESDFIRINKYLANAGICSRREADTFIKAGLVKVNGIVITELGTKIKKTDEVKYNGSTIKSERPVYILMNKPKNTLTTAHDDRGRLTVRDIIGTKVKERIYPVGRLDKDSTGVLLLTNDGDMTLKLTHPKNLKKKIYHVFTNKPIAHADINKLMEGFELEDGFSKCDVVNYSSMENKREVGVELHSGKNRIIRRMFEHLGYSVEKLDRVYFAGLTKKSLRRGYWRHLTDQELGMLKMGSYD